MIDNRRYYHSARYIFLTTFVSALGCISSVARGQWSSNAAINFPIANATNEQVQPKIRLTSDGGSYVSWFDNRAGGYDVYLQRLDAAGNELWAHNGILVADRSVSSTEDYGLAVDANDNAILAYGLVNFSSVGAQKIAPSGAFQWGPTGLTFNTPGGSHSPKMVATSDGNYVIGWSEGLTIVLNKLDVNGTAQWGSGVIVTDPANMPILLADLQPSDNGGVIAEWMRCGGANCILSNKHLHAQKFNTAGVAQWNGGAPRIIFDGSSIQNGNFPPIISDGAGGAVFAWYETGGSNFAFVQHVDASGTELFPHNGVACTTATAGRIRISAGVSYDPVAQEIFLGWTETTVPTQNMWGVRAQKFSSAGVRQWGNEGVSLVALNANQSGFVDTNALAGGCVVSWFDARSATTAVVRIARLDTAGALAWSHSPFDASSRLTGKGRLDTVIDACGTTLLVWEDGASGAADILGQNVQANRLLGPVPPGLPGDMDCSGAIDVNDIAPFVEALLDAALFNTQHPCCNASHADVNQDAAVNGEDVDAFAQAIL